MGVCRVSAVWLGVFVPAVRGEDGTFLKKRCIYAVSAGNATPKADQGDDGCGTALFRPGKASVGVCGALGGVAGGAYACVHS